MPIEEAEAARWIGLSPSEYAALPGTMDWTTEEEPLSKCEVLAKFQLAMLTDAIMEDARWRKKK